jgi:hypothetical protein
VGDGRKIRFWGDQWFSSCSLAIQYWEIYSLVHEQGKTIREAWDGQDLRFSFRRTVDNRLMSQWLEVVQIASSLQYSEEEDTMIWKFNSSGKFSVQSLYTVINDKGVRQIFTPVVWKLKVPPKLHIFLWLLANNKTITRDNLAKRRDVEDESCLFCEEKESIYHLFFDCCVARVMWKMCSEIAGKQLGADFESVAKFWLHDKSENCLNVLTTAVFWSIWKFRNDMCFQGRKWSGMQEILRSWLRMVKDWMLLQSAEGKVRLETWVERMEEELTRPPALQWASGIQAPRGVGQGEIGDSDLLCNDYMSVGCNELNSTVEGDCGTVT